MSSLWPTQSTSKPKPNQQQLFSWFPTSNEEHSLDDNEEEDDHDDFEDIHDNHMDIHYYTHKKDFSTILEDSAEYKNSMVMMESSQDSNTKRTLNTSNSFIGQEEGESPTTTTTQQQQQQQQQVSGDGDEVFPSESIDDNDNNNTDNTSPQANADANADVNYQPPTPIDAQVYPTLRMTFAPVKMVRVPDHLRPQGSSLHASPRDRGGHNGSNSGGGGNSSRHDNGNGSNSVGADGYIPTQGGGHGYTRTQKLDWFPEGTVSYEATVRSERDGSTSHQQQQREKEREMARLDALHRDRYIHGEDTSTQQQAFASARSSSPSRPHYGYGHGPQYAGGISGTYQYKDLPHVAPLSANLGSVKGIYTNTMVITPYNTSPRRARSPEKLGTTGNGNGNGGGSSDNKVVYNPDMKLPMVSSSSRSKLMASSYIPPSSTKVSAYHAQQRPVADVRPRSQETYVDRWASSLEAIERTYTPATQYSLAGPVSAKNSRNPSASTTGRCDPGTLPPLRNHKKTGQQSNTNNTHPHRQSSHNGKQSHHRNSKQLTGRKEEVCEPMESDVEVDRAIRDLEASCGIFCDILEREQIRKRQSKPK